MSPVVTWSPVDFVLYLILQAISEVILGYSSQDTSGIDNLSGAVDRVFQEFNNSGTECHNTLVVFTDKDSMTTPLRQSLQRNESTKVQTLGAT